MALLLKLEVAAEKPGDIECIASFSGSTSIVRKALGGISRREYAMLECDQEIGQFPENLSGKSENLWINIQQS